MSGTTSGQGNGGEGTLRVGVAGDGGLRWAAADLTPVVEEARERHDLSPVAAAALGRSLGAAALLLRLSAKTPVRLTFEIVASGPLGRVVAEAEADGGLRGMVGRPRVEVPSVSGKLAVGRAVGAGTLRVSRYAAGGGTWSSQVDLVSGEVGEDVAHFLAQSEQIPSAVLLGVLARPDGIAAAGGLIVQALPEAEDDALERLEANIAALGAVSREIEAEGLAGLLERVLVGLAPRRLQSRPQRYRCRCSRERLRVHLARLEAEELESLRRRDGSLEAVCRFCAEELRFERGEIRDAPDVS